MTWQHLLWRHSHSMKWVNMKSKLKMLLPCNFFYYCMRCHVGQWRTLMGSGSKLTYLSLGHKPQMQFLTCFGYSSSWFAEWGLHERRSLVRRWGVCVCVCVGGENKNCSYQLENFCLLAQNAQFSLCPPWIFHDVSKVRFHQMEGSLWQLKRPKTEDHRETAQWHEHRPICQNSAPNLSETIQTLD